MSSAKRQNLRARRGTMPDSSRTMFPPLASSKSKNAESAGAEDEYTFLSHLPMILLNAATISKEQWTDKQGDVPLDDLKKGLQYENRALELAEETFDDQLIMRVLLHNVRTKIQICMHEQLSKDESAELAQEAAKHFYRLVELGKVNEDLEVFESLLKLLEVFPTWADCGCSLGISRRCEQVEREVQEEQTCQVRQVLCRQARQLTCRSSVSTLSSPISSPEDLEERDQWARLNSGGVQEDALEILPEGEEEELGTFGRRRGRDLLQGAGGGSEVSPLNLKSGGGGGGGGGGGVKSLTVGVSRRKGDGKGSKGKASPQSTPSPSVLLHRHLLAKMSPAEKVAESVRSQGLRQRHGYTLARHPPLFVRCLRCLRVLGNSRCRRRREDRRQQECRQEEQEGSWGLCTTGKSRLTLLQQVRRRKMGGREEEQEEDGWEREEEQEEEQEEVEAKAGGGGEVGERSRRRDEDEGKAGEGGGGGGGGT
eukprot:758159-Hanusia_phi.AAC.3